MVSWPTAKISPLRGIFRMHHLSLNSYSILHNEKLRKVSNDNLPRIAYRDSFLHTTGYNSMDTWFLRMRIIRCRRICVAQSTLYFSLTLLLVSLSVLKKWQSLEEAMRGWPQLQHMRSLVQSKPSLSSSPHLKHFTFPLHWPLPCPNVWHR